MVYYNHDFYKFLRSCYAVYMEDDVLILQRTQDDEYERIPYSSLNELDAKALLHFMGIRIRVLKERLAQL